MRNLNLFFIICAIIICMFCFSACDNNSDNTPNNEFKKVAALGEVPSELNKIVTNNVFRNVKAIDSKLIECYYDYTSSVHTIKLLSNYGEILARYERELPVALNECNLFSTIDGGYITAFGFQDYALGDDVWASDSGVYSLILKFDANGNLEWETKLDVFEYDMLDFCIERNNGYYFFGTQETPETEIKGVGSPGDIHIALLDKSGKLINSIAYEGSDYDWITYVEENNDNFVIYGNSQSSNGIFASLKNNTGYPVNFKLVVDADFQIISISKINYTDIPSKEFIGITGEKKIYTNDNLVINYDAGTVKLIIDYKDFYLIVSENKIGIDNSSPFLSSIQYLTETVYSAYDKNNTLIWRATIDN